MSELSKKDSSSDVDSNSSWTLLSEDSSRDGDRSSEIENKQAEENVATEPEKNENGPESKENELAPEDLERKSYDNEINHENDIESINSSTCSLNSFPEAKTQESDLKDGCTIVGEYLNDKELAHDYDYDERAEVWENLQNNDKRKKRKYKKSKDESFTTMTIVGAVLSLAGISLICMMSPLFTKQVLSPSLQSSIERNFSNIETPYAAANNLKLYINKSDKMMTLSEKVSVLDPYLQECCSYHINSTESRNVLPKSTKTAKMDKPISYEQFLRENSEKTKNDAEVVKDLKERPKSKVFKSEKAGKTNEHKKVEQLKSSKNKDRSVEQQDKLTVKSTKNNISPENKKTKAQVDIKKGKKEIENKRTSEKFYSLSKKEASNNVEGNKTQIIQKAEQIAFEEKTKSNEDVKRSDGNRKSNGDIKKSEAHVKKTEMVLADVKHFSKAAKKLPNANMENFVLVSKEEHKGRDVRNHMKIVSPTSTKISSKDGNTLLPSKTTKNEEGNGINFEAVKAMLPNQLKAATVPNKPAKQARSTPSKSISNASVASSNQTPVRKDNHINFVACQLLQDLCMLRLAGKLGAKEKTKQRKLKRKLDKTKLRDTNQTPLDVSTSEEDHLKKTNESKIRINSVNHRKENKSLAIQKSAFNFKPKLVNNHFVTELKSTGARNKSKLSNLELLKELPFMTDNRKVNKVCPTIKPHPNISDSGFAQRIQHFSFENLATKEDQKTFCPRSLQSDASLMKRQGFLIYSEIAKQKSAQFLEDARKKNEERLKILEQMRKDNRLKIDAIIRERRERLKKDAALGIYNVPLPKYTEFSEKLKQLKKRRTQSGFLVETASSSDSESEKKCPKSVESKISCELMTALKMGKKVSDTFREWTLKKAPSLTCLKNYCNSKVFQISERLTSQSTNQTNIKPTLDKEELEALKCRREKHEQLKRFWRAKQEYLDKRIEICDLIKKKLANEENTEKTLSEQNIAQGVQILDCIINDVLKTVKNTKNRPEDRLHVENEVNKPLKCVGSVAQEETEKEKKVEEKPLEAYAASTDDLYSCLFEERAMEIRKRDKGLWNVAQVGHVERKKEISKQDPSKGYQGKIIKKHN